ncbi:MAG: methionyl-tRNA formyltransferase [Clostridia bacterium]|nr:methionyl-tRNA formyltransferase [Clostridia bacterium]
MRIVFMGTPEFAVPSLRALLDNGYEVVGAITQPDRPAGRGHKLTPCPVKLLAQERGVPVYQFEKIKNPEGVECLRALKPDLVVTAAFGQLLSREILEIPQYGTVNVHASLLPKYRGSAPINWCILNGEKVAGVTTMLTDVGMDTGDMLLKAQTDIGELETAGELTQRLSEIGAKLLIDTLKFYPNGGLKSVPQNAAEASYQPMLTKEMGRIDWTKSAEEISRQVRGLNPWPCAYTENGDGRLKIYLARPCDAAGAAEPGCVAVSSAKEGLKIACGEGWLEVLEMQAPNAKRMSAKAYLQGKRIEIGTKFN